MRFRAFQVVMIFALVEWGTCFSGKGTPAPAQLIDSGSFGVFVAGKRVATETFKIEQRPDASLTHSEIKVEGGTDKVSQTADMQLAANGSLIRYQWQQAGAPKSQLTVEPSDQFLVEHIDDSSNGETKSHVVPHILAPSTVILDDNFFSHREVLAWRYLASGCSPAKEQLTCKLERLPFGTLVPNQHAAMTVYMQYLGVQKTHYKGAERELASFKLESENGDWVLWLDNQQKLVKITIPGENTEVLRD